MMKKLGIVVAAIMLCVLFVTLVGIDTVPATQIADGVYEIYDGNIYTADAQDTSDVLLFMNRENDDRTQWSIYHIEPSDSWLYRFFK